MKHFDDLQIDELNRREELAIFCAALTGMLASEGQLPFSEFESDVVINHARDIVRISKIGGTNGFANLSSNTNKLALERDTQRRVNRQT